MKTNLQKYQNHFESFAKQQLPQQSQHIGEVYDAVDYSFFAAGKRLRPALVYALAESLNISKEKVDSVALAIECIHTYSLIHDDLPAMDDDDFRRGQPACHKKFGEATAILAGDALNTFAFEILSKPRNDISPNKQLQQITTLAQSAGISGMIGGQDTDLACENNKTTINLEQLSQLHIAKTARLIKACFIATYLCNDSMDPKKLSLLSQAALSLGLFYQIQDDILDVTQSSSTLGKPTGSDIDNGKTTYVSLMGLKGAQREAQKQLKKIENTLTQFFAPQPYKETPLHEIITVISSRQH
ncbi:MAG: polyprenyl synthetase family protein [Gammaproteobacteria bacterium]|nr:polyprenyl synthetase family protein [Gammaproteobacteria bacterium]